MLAVILLNWCGADVTIECLRSLEKIKSPDYFVILADNGSGDDSPERLSRWLGSESGHDVIEIREGEENRLPDSLPSGSLVYYRLNENYGFAKGNNKCVALASRYNPEYGLLLNNDTEVEPDALAILSGFMDSHPEVWAATPQICYFDRKDLVWNCGGTLFYGLRRYYHARRPSAEVPDKESFPITFVTGCALFFRFDLVENGKLLTERFFHGEEDFEFSYRMKDAGRKMVCVPASRIYHKVSVSINKFGSAGTKYVYYLNRFINMRQRMGTLSFRIWETLYRPYVRRLLRRNGLTESETSSFLTRLKTDCRRYDGVSRELFFELVKKD